MAKGVSIVLVPPVGQVAQLGTDQARGVWAEDVSWDHTLPDHGARQCQFTVRRKPGQEWPDLQPFTPIIIYKGGSVAWSGRVQQTPTIRGRENQITVIGEGWPAHLRDDAIERVFVHNDLTAWKDARTFSPASLATYTTAYQTELSGTPLIRVPNNNTVAINTIGGITLDAGPYSTIKRVVVTYIGGGHANFNLKYLAGDTAAAATETAVLDAAPIAAVSTTVAFTLTTARRFVTLYMDAVAAGTVILDTAWVQFTNIICVADTAYESGNVSILKASQILPVVLPYAPKVSQSTVGITTTAFTIPHFAGPLASAWDYIEAANGYHSYQWFLRDGADGGSPSLIFRAVPTSPLLVANVGNGIEFNDASRNDGSEIYNRAVVEFTDAAGNTAREERTTANLSASFTSPAIAYDTFSAVSAGPNPGFETAGGPPPTGWATTVGTLTRDIVVFDTGVASGRVTSSAGGQFGGSTQVTGLTPGRTYVLKYRVRANAAWLAGSLALQVNDLTLGVALSTVDVFSNAIGVAFTSRSVTFVARTTGAAIGIAGNITAAADICYLDGFTLLEARPTIVDRQGFIRTKVLTTGARLTAAAADQLGDVYLAAHRFTPLRGTLTVQGAAVRTLLGDAPIPAHLLGGRYLGEAILINETDPDLGTIGRVGTIASSAYDEANDTANIAIDVTKDYVDTLLARLAVFS